MQSAKSTEETISLAISTIRSTLISFSSSPSSTVDSTVSESRLRRLSNPKIGIVCGSGLSGLVKSLRDVIEIPYGSIEGFGRSTVIGHKSALAFGFIGEDAGIPVVAMLGRFHPYEGHSMSSVVYPIRVMARLGVTDIIITNAAGSLNPNLPVGTITVIRDHLALPNLTGLNPLFGPPTSLKHARFLPLSDAYSPALQRLAFIAGAQLKLPSIEVQVPGSNIPLSHDALEEGVYAWVSGPTYETPAEGRFLRSIGADVVGMSTVPEVVAAREEGLRVLVLSLVTNLVVIPEKERSVKEEVLAEMKGEKVDTQPAAVVSHEEVLTLGREKGETMRQLVQKIVELIVAERGV